MFNATDIVDTEINECDLWRPILGDFICNHFGLNKCESSMAESECSTLDLEKYFYSTMNYSREFMSFQLIGLIEPLKFT